MSHESISAVDLLTRAEEVVNRLEIREMASASETCRLALRRVSSQATAYVIAEAVSALFLALHLTAGVHSPKHIFERARGLLTGLYQFPEGKFFD